MQNASHKKGRLKLDLFNIECVYAGVCLGSSGIILWLNSEKENLVKWGLSVGLHPGIYWFLVDEFNLM